MFPIVDGYRVECECGYTSAAGGVASGEDYAELTSAEKDAREHSKGHTDESWGPYRTFVYPLVRKVTYQAGKQIDKA